MINLTLKPGDVKVTEFGRIVIDGEPTGTIRVRIEIIGRKFKRLFQWGYAPVWSEEGIPGFCDDQQSKDLEAIFKGWCTEHKEDINNPLALLKGKDNG